MSTGEDSEFWNQVLQRFTAAKLQVAQLTTELNQVKREVGLWRFLPSVLIDILHK